MKQNQIRVGIIGMGRLGKFHAEKYAQSAQASIVGVVDTDIDVCTFVNHSLGLRVFDSIDELLHEGVDCCSIATPTSSHFEVALKLLSNGVDVLIEKPIASTSEQAQILVELSKRHKRILQIGHVERFNPGFLALKKLVKNPFYIEAKRVAPFTGRGQDVDVILDLMIHDIDIIMQLVNEPVAQIEAVGSQIVTNSTDTAKVRIAFESGTYASITASRASAASERRISIFQPESYLELDYSTQKLKVGSSGLSSEGIKKVNVSEYAVKRRDALTDQIQSFLECVKTRSDPVVTGLEGTKVLNYAHIIQELILGNTESTFDVQTRIQANESGVY